MFQGKISSSFKVLQINRKENFFIEFKPYKDNEYLENSYYKMPQELFVNSLYKDKLNSDSKILYAFLLDRKKLGHFLISLVKTLSHFFHTYSEK